MKAPVLCNSGGKPPHSIFPRFSSRALASGAALFRVRAVICLNQVSKSFDGRRSWALRDVSFHVKAGEWLVLLGSSGSGKSTLLKLINRLVDDFEGSLTV